MHVHAGGIFPNHYARKVERKIFVYTSQKQLTHFDLPQHCMIVLLPVKNSWHSWPILTHFTQ